MCEHRQHLQIVTAIPIHGDILCIDAQLIGQMQDRGPLVHTAGRDLKMSLAARRIDERIGEVRRAAGEAGFAWEDECLQNGWYAVRMRRL